MAQKPTPEFRAEAVRVALTSGLPRQSHRRRGRDDAELSFGALGVEGELCPDLLGPSENQKTDSRFRPRLTCAAFRDTPRARGAGIPKTFTEVKVLGPRKSACRCRLTGRIQAKRTEPDLSGLFG